MLTVSDTAYAIAAIRAMESALPASERLFDDPYAAIFHASGAHASEGTQRFLELPFFRDGIRLRTRFIDDAVRAGLRAGLEQVVLLGAGFDARGLRLPEIAERHATVYEVDFAGLLEVKRALLAAAGIHMPEWISYVPCDFNAPDFDQGLTTALEARGLRLGAGAIFVWEGVIGYIDRATIDRSLGFMARVGGPRTHVVFTYGPDTFEPETAIEHLQRAGFSRCEEHAGDELWRRYLPGEPHPNAWASRLGIAVV